MNKIEPYASHLPVLATCLCHTSGPIIELGCGFYSTPLLSLAAMYGRQVDTYETNSQWLDQIADLLPARPRSHRLIAIDSYDGIPLPNKWELALIDHEPGNRRAADIERLSGCCDIFVAHDTELRVRQLYNYEPVFRRFKHRFDTTINPRTTVVSTSPLDWIGPEKSASVTVSVNPS